jgi:hypothetical protein
MVPDVPRALSFLLSAVSYSLFRSQLIAVAESRDRATKVRTAKKDAGQVRTSPVSCPSADTPDCPFCATRP